MNNIKVFFNESHLLITAHRPSDISSYKLIIDKEEDVFTFRMEPYQLFDAKYKGNILVVTDLSEETLESLFDYADGVIAAGGIVKNENNETLIIHRRGFWDLPKGKVEKGEKIRNAAKREVEEETGVTIAEQSEEATITYHCYNLKGKDCIKETHWYTMLAHPGQLALKPQTEEDIEQAIWATDAAIKALDKEFYPLIWQLLKEQLAL
jgi:8-oxo-dGTP pyrophosphatase MutT (NUDIX family)